MATASATDIRAKLAALGKRRKKHEANGDELTDDMTKALKEAYGKVPVSEAADLLGIHRTTVYRVYHPHE